MTPDELISRSASRAVRLRQEAANLSLEIERQISNKDGPLKYILASAHQEAVHAFMLLGEIDPTQVDQIRNLQNDIKRYSDLAFWLQAALNDGNAAFKELDGETIAAFDEAFSVSDEDN